MAANPIGSSPRGRGKLVEVVADIRVVGLIPAQAGKTPVISPKPFSATAHPRAGEENLKTPPTPLPDPGSSPRGRGKLTGQGGLLVWARLIPARAGKTLTPTSTCTTLRAHPRAGGENQRYRGPAQRSCGSSPHGRGKHLHCHPLVSRRGLIPARAGKTRPGRGIPSSPRAHSRAGGENAAMRQPAFMWTGSSPRGRGKHGDTPVAG